MSPLDDITPLDAVRWERARKLAGQTVQAATPKPDQSHYIRQSFNVFHVG